MSVKQDKLRSEARAKAHEDFQSGVVDLLQWREESRQLTWYYEKYVFLLGDKDGVVVKEMQELYKEALASLGEVNGYSVCLEAVNPEYNLEVIKAIRNCTPEGLWMGLKAAHDAVRHTPSILFKGLDEATASRIQNIIRKAGARVTYRPSRKSDEPIEYVSVEEAQARSLYTTTPGSHVPGSYVVVGSKSVTSPTPIRWK